MWNLSFKTRVSLFYFFSFFFYAFFFLAFFFPSSSSFFNATNLKTRSSDRPPSIQSSRLAHPSFNCPINQIISSFFLYSSKLQIMPLQICSFFVLLKIVLPLFFFRSNLFQEQNRVLETRFCFLELESRSMWHHTSNSPSRNQVFNPRVLD